MNVFWSYFVTLCSEEYAIIGAGWLPKFFKEGKHPLFPPAGSRVGARDDGCVVSTNVREFVFQLKESGCWSMCNLTIY